MSFYKVVLTFIATLSLTIVEPVTASECTYRIARDFRDLQSDANRGNITVGDVVELLLETDDTLVRHNTKTNLIEPGLAKSWSYDEENKQFVFSLNQSCRWSDGEPIKAADFVYAFQELHSHGTEPGIGGNLIAGADGIIHKGSPLSTLQVKSLADDQLSVQITGEPSIALLYFSYVVYSPIPSHIYNSKYHRFASPRRQTIGPFKVKSVAKETIVLDRNPYYCTDSRPTIDRIEISNRKEGYWEFAQVMDGKLDMIRYTPEKQLQVLKDKGPAHEVARIELIDEQRQTHLLINPLHGDFAKREIRQKLISAIDYKGLTARGNAHADVRKVARTLFYDLPNYENYRYSLDVDNTQQGLAELRATMEKHGYSAQKPFKVSISTYPLARFESSAKMISSMLRSAHFDMQFIKTSSVSDHVEQSQAGRFELLFSSWSMDYSDPQSSLDGIIQELNYLLKEESNSRLNHELSTEFIEPYVKLLAKLKSSASKSTRFAILQELEELFVANALHIPLYTEYSPIVVSNRVGELHGALPRARTLVLNDCTQE